MSINSNIHKENWYTLILSKGKWYLLSSLFSKGLSIILLPVYTRYLNPSDYGVLNSLVSVGGIVVLLMSLYLDTALGRFYFDSRNDIAELSKLFSTVFLFVSVNGIAIFVIISVFSGFWFEKIFNKPYLQSGFLYFLSIIFLQLGQLGLVFLRQGLEARRTTAVEIFSNIIMVLITLPLLMFLRIGIYAKIMGTLIQSIFVLAYYLIYFTRKGILRLNIDVKILKKCLMFSLPLLPNVIGGWISSLSDRLLIGKYTNQYSVGVYSIASQIGLFVYLIQDAVTQVTGPIVLSGLVSDYDETKRKIAKFSINLWSALLFITSVITLFQGELLLFFSTREYSGAAGLIGLFSFSYIIGAQNRIRTDILLFLKKSKYISIGSVVGSCFSLALNVLFIPIFGYEIAAVVFLISSIANFVVLHSSSQKFITIKYDYHRYIPQLLVFIISYLVALLLDHSFKDNYLNKSLLKCTMIIINYIVFLMNSRKLRMNRLEHT